MLGHANGTGTPMPVIGSLPYPPVLAFGPATPAPSPFFVLARVRYDTLSSRCKRLVALEWLIVSIWLLVCSEGGIVMKGSRNVIRVYIGTRESV